MAIGHVETSLSRAAVDWMVKTADLTTLINQLNNNNFYGIDELFMATLQVTEALEMPGGFTAKCIQHETVVPSFVKLVFWRGNPMEKYCQSKKWRHSVCVFGIKDFKTLATTSQFLANKVLPYFDYAVVDCLHEVIFNRTYLGQVDYDLNLDLYRKHVSVRS
ncbi:unnamed protein product [Heligmosomoides polygyrus]|uniref:Nucleotid_trans domain-containing protein n=1 Tax=Heligmosomoides polygyrus TaxID=6339 RepID=A0A183F5B5_HELPZ|nr:unnamed protein product [Heligmosomoides polygyrus]